MADDSYNFYGMTFYNDTNATQSATLFETESNSRNIAGIVSCVFVSLMFVGTIGFCIRQRLVRKPAFHEI